MQEACIGITRIMENGNAKINGYIWEWIRNNWAILITLIAFIIRVEVFIREGPRFTSADAGLMEARILSAVDVRFDKLPPDWYREQVKDDITRIEKKIDALLEELRQRGD